MKRLLLASTSMAVLFALTSCSSDSSSGGSSNVTLSGTIGSSSDAYLRDSFLNPALSKNSRTIDEWLLNSRSLRDLFVHPRVATTSVAGDTLRCRTTDSAQTVTTTTIADDGSFSLAIPSGVGVKCDVVDAADSDVVNASFVLESEENKAMNGENKTSDAFVPAADIALGDIEFDPYQSSITIDQDSHESEVTAATVDAPWDFTGTYEAAAYTGTVPAGYSEMCEQLDDNCQSVVAGETFYLKQIEGLAVNSSGLTTTTPKYGIAVWKSLSAFEQCGSKLGFTYDDAITNAKIDLTDSGIAEGSLDWTSSVSVATAITGWDGSNTVIAAGNSTVTSGWKFSGAKAGWDMQDCETVQVGTGAEAVPGWKCYDGSDYQISLGGGCVDADNAPINVTDWSGLTCDNETLTGTFDGYTRSTCTGAFESQQVTCTYTFTQTAGFDWNNVNTLVAQGGNCSTISTSTAKGALAQMRCYADSYWRFVDSIRGTDAEESYCFRDLRTDWSATTADGFIVNNGPEKPTTQYVLELFDYTSNTTGTFRNQEFDARGVEVISGGNTIWINCRMVRVMTMNLTRTSESPDTILAEMIQESHLIDTKESCWTDTARSSLGGLDENGKSTVRTLFNMVKQD